MHTHTHMKCTHTEHVHTSVEKCSEVESLQSEADGLRAELEKSSSRQQDMESNANALRADLERAEGMRGDLEEVMKGYETQLESLRGELAGALTEKEGELSILSQLVTWLLLLHNHYIIQSCR